LTAVFTRVITVFLALFKVIHAIAEPWDRKWDFPPASVYGGRASQAVVLNAFFREVDEFGLTDQEGAFMQSALLKICSGLRRLIQEEDGQDLVEYGLLILLCVVTSVASVGGLATIVVNYYQFIVSSWPSY